MRRIEAVVLAAVTLVGAAAPSSPADSLTAAADAQTSSLQPTSGFGNMPVMAVRRGARGAALISYLRFDVSTLASEPGVPWAVLRLGVRSVATPGTIEVLPVLGPWQEGTIAAGAAPELGAPVAVFAVEEGHASRSVDVDVTGLVREWAAGSLENHGLALRAEGSGAANVTFHTREGFLTSHAPSLEVMRSDGPSSLAAVPGEPDGALTPSRIPAGSVMFFDRATCPNGWSPFVEARGRVVMGLHPGGALRGTVGTALPDLTTRTITTVAAHTHGVTVAAESAHTHGVTVAAESAHTHPVSLSAESAHTHSVDHPVFITGSGGLHTHTTDSTGSSHSHGIPANQAAGNEDAVDWFNNTGNGNTALLSTGSGGTHTHGVTTTGSSHTHAIDVPNLPASGPGTSHTHTAVADAGTSHTHTATAGAGTSHTHTATASSTGVASVDVTMPYVQLLACRKD